MFHSKIKSDYFQFSEIKGKKLTKYSKYFQPQSTQHNFSIMVWSVDHGRTVTSSACPLYGIKKAIQAKALEGFSVLGGFRVFFKIYTMTKVSPPLLSWGFQQLLIDNQAADKVASF